MFTVRDISTGFLQVIFINSTPAGRKHKGRIREEKVVFEQHKGHLNIQTQCTVFPHKNASK